MIALFTDFGLEGPYIGQVKAVLHAGAPGVPVIDLVADAPAHEPQLAAYLLAALVREFPAGTVFLGVVDPGVGGAREAVIVEADGRLYVGPHNGLFEIVLRHAVTRAMRRIDWRPERLSASFHGRDLFAPVAAMLATGRHVAATALALERSRPGGHWPADLARVVYVDRFGNAMTGWRAAQLSAQATIAVHGRALPRARTFADMRPGEAFWYENANGLAEIAVNQGRADRLLGLSVGTDVTIKP
jgi:S-adenosylmethionine hydrolase